MASMRTWPTAGFLRPNGALARAANGAVVAAFVPVALAVSLSWPLALAGAGDPGAEHLEAWLGWNRGLASGPTGDTLGYALETVPWFFWPAWPLAGWALWRWRERRLEPALRADPQQLTRRGDRIPQRTHDRFLDVVEALGIDPLEHAEAYDPTVAAGLTATFAQGNNNPFNSFEL